MLSQLTIRLHISQLHNSFIWPGHIFNKFHLAAAYQHKKVAIEIGNLNKRAPRWMTALSSETDLVLFVWHTHANQSGPCMNKCTINAMLNMPSSPPMPCSPMDLTWVAHTNLLVLMSGSTPLHRVCRQDATTSANGSKARDACALK
jgi:hypothetical protein